MLILGAFINNIVNTLIRNLDMPIRVIISAVFIAVAFLSFCLMFKNVPKDKPGLKYGWLILCLFSMAMSVCYLVL